MPYIIVHNNQSAIISQIAGLGTRGFRLLKLYSALCVLSLAYDVDDNLTVLITPSSTGTGTLDTVKVIQVLLIEIDGTDGAC